MGMPSKVGIAALIVAIVAALWFFTTRQVAGGNAASVGPAAESGPASEVKTPPSIQVGSSTSLEQRYIPDRLRSAPAAERFDYAKDCLTFKRFDALFARNASNPNYPLNNPDALNAMPPAERRLLNDRVELVRAKRGECADWSKQVSDTDALPIIYSLALQAGLSGDIDSGICFAMAPWGAPPQGTKEFEDFERLYRTHAKRLIDAGIARGNWTAVMTANNALNTEHRFKADIGYSRLDAYVFSRLLQLGISNQELADGYGYQAARIAPELSPGDLTKANNQATQLFSSRFDGKAMTEEAMYENCGN